ncbi:GT-D fold domain-containing glycosyltransferase [Flavobacterium sp. SUN052]|uniref:GT-D fold domain-containing glycosyltransferase n=1 Tax=Flavobacterium sp. SUN052 TaxID=3002441 RepID=UPI00237E8912|nr:GT-D fold domain-containing glycosyltransferase [Flavobacterium sp. SUN052]MEC4004431.1 GT-D fold domain-containing glycosyltransferase [Flavobacterium sp. SUN052]
MKDIETIDLIINKKSSISRFGDGELKIMLKKAGLVFQSENLELAERLKEVLCSNLDNHLVGLPRTFQTVNGEILNSKYYWLGFINKFGKELSSYLDSKKVYANAGISRFYIGRTDKKLSKKIINRFQQVWNNKDLLIVEGNFSRMGVGNDLFKNAASLERILCPSEHAFNYYPEILSSVQTYGKDKLILIALGPTATVLSYDLAKSGYWALDIGHIDIEYMWMLANVVEKTPVKGRYVSENQEIIDLDIPSEYKEDYLKSIILKIEVE